MARTASIFAYDTDLIGPYGYCCDISAEPGKVGMDQGLAEPTPYAEADLSATRYDHIHDQHGAAEAPASPSTSWSRMAHRLLPEKYAALALWRRMVHGVGLCDEYPSIRYPHDHGRRAVIRACWSRACACASKPMWARRAAARG